VASTYTNLLYHLVFSTKDRRSLITPALRAELYPYIGGIVHHERGVLLEIGGMPDHVHLVTKFRADVSVAEMLRLIKANSSKWANERRDLTDGFAWQTGYGAFSVSESQRPALRSYVQNQEEHHRRLSFKEEFRALLDKHGIAYDERYLWV
jgi:putative transposase